MDRNQGNSTNGRQQRGATGVAYGLVVGLIAIVALGSITVAGDAIRELFTKTETTLEDVVNETTATPVPSPEASPPGPDSFDFVDAPGAAGSTVISSDTITLNGSFTGLAVSISGGTNSQFSVNGGSWGTSGTASAGDSLQLRTTSGGSAGNTATVIVTVGPASADWVVTTRSDCGGNRCIFFTSTTYNGNLGGGVGADDKCQARADAVGLTGTFKAYLSEGSPGQSAASRFNWANPYYNLSGNLVTNSQWPYTTNWTTNGITDENGVMISSSIEFWSNTASSGSHCGGGTGSGAPYTNCNQFTTTSGSYQGINGSYNGNTVTHLCSVWRSCTNGYRLLCVETQ